MSEPREFIETYGIKNLVSAFSGGADSLVATHFMFESIRDLNVEKYVAWVDTGVMIPIAEPFVKEVCEKLSWRLEVLKPDRGFFEEATKRGSPNMFRRWCCPKLKIEPVVRFVQSLSSVSAQVIGLRSGESRKRRELPQIFIRKGKRGFAFPSYAPILNWTREQVWDYIKHHNLPKPPWYDMGIKETCSCGVFSSIEELERICRLWPEFFRQFIELERHHKQGTGSAFWDRSRNRPIFAREIWQKVWRESL